MSSSSLKSQTPKNDAISPRCVSEDKAQTT